MYKKHFGFREPPFSIAPDPRFLYMSEQHREAMAHLVYGMRHDGGFVLLTGDVGTGKTTICRCLLEQTVEGTDIAFILNPKVSAEELLATICDELGIAYPGGSVSVKIFVDRINAYLLDAFGRGRKTVLIIEEAQNLRPDVLEQVRLLTNLETNQQKLLKIIMIGQPELKEMLSSPEMEQLSQRVTARYHIGPLQRNEVSAYVDHRVSVAGGRNGIFPDSVIGLLHSLSRGIPRLINVICDRALLGAYAEGKEVIDKKTVVQASHEIFGEPAVRTGRRKKLAWVAAGVLVIGCIAAIASGFYGKVNSIQESRTAQPLQAASKTPEVGIRGMGEAGVKSSVTVWPSLGVAGMSRELAYQSLFKEWGVAFQMGRNEDVCKAAQAGGLRCLEGAASFKELVNLNRPMVLKLLHDDGKEFYALLKGIEEQKAVLIAGKETIRVALSDVEKRWLGDYLLFWKAPEDYKGNIYPGDKGPEVRWLERLLSAEQGKSPDPKKSPTYDGDLMNRVKKFQLGEGIAPDGVAGPQTIIHLVNKKAAKGPFLRGQNKGDE